MPDLVWIVPTGTDTSLIQGEPVTPGTTISTNWFIAVNENDRSQFATSYELWGGHLPTGLTLTQATYSPPSQPGGLGMYISGIAAPVSKPTTSTFVIRAWSNTISDTSYIDGTFSYTVLTTAPYWATPEGNIANILTGNDIGNSSSNFDTQVNYIEPTLDGNVRVSLLDGTVPPGLIIDTEAASGNVGNLTDTNHPVNISGVPYYDPDYADTQGIGADANAFVKTYEFTLNLNDSNYQANATYAINIYAREFLTADMDVSPEDTANLQYFTFTADSDYTQLGYPQEYPTADFTFPPYPNGPTPNMADPYPANQFRFSAAASGRYSPWIVTPPGPLGNTVSLDFYAQKISTANLSGATIIYTLDVLNPDGTPSQLPYGLQLDPYTGYIWGNPQSDFNATYRFTITATDETDPAYIGKSVTYSIFVYGKSPLDITWSVPFQLGNINNGSTSEFYVSATTKNNDLLYYEQTSGELPPGLVLQESGLIVGSVIFDTPSPSYEYEFQVTAKGVYIDISSTATFRIRVLHVNDTPFNNLYIQAYGREPSRILIQNILQDYNVMPINQIYRFSDPNFGISKNLKFLQAVNINATNSDTIYEAMTYNHYRKVVGLGPFNYAVARDATGTIVYEVVYCPVLDDLVNSQGQSVSVDVPLEYPIQVADQTVTDVFPNSLLDMRRRIYGIVGQANSDLPRWMTSVQPDKSVIGFIPAWIICYALPGYGDDIAYRLNQKYSQTIKQLDFDIDRYELDDRLTYRYSVNTSNVGSWNYPINTSTTGYVTGKSQDTITVKVFQDSLIPTLSQGDTITWANTTNSAMTTTVLGLSPISQVIDINLTNGGNGYSAVTPPRVKIAPPVGGIGKAAEANVTVGTTGSNIGRLTGITLTYTGYGYHQQFPIVTIDPPPNGNTANTATATANTRLSPLEEIYITNPGFGYTRTPNVYVQQPSWDPLNPSFNPASNTASIQVVSLSGSGIGFAFIDKSGRNYESAPQITVDPSPRGNTARISGSISYQIQVGNSSNFIANVPSSGILGSNIYLFNTYAPGDELNKYYLFPRVNILE